MWRRRWKLRGRLKREREMEEGKGRERREIEVELKGRGVGWKPRQEEDKGEKRGGEVEERGGGGS